MKTSDYNPSPLEIRFASILKDLREEISAKMDGLRIYKVEDDLKQDNPTVQFHLEDGDGDLHHIVIKIIQRPDH
jgi:hypothetical protein